MNNSNYSNYLAFSIVTYVMFVVICTFVQSLVLVTGSYTKSANVPASVSAFPWMGPKSTTGFILIMRSFTCRPNHDMGPIF